MSETTERMAQLNYDKDSDVLYISLGEPEPADDGLEHCGVVHRYRGGELIGLTIMNAKERLK